MNRSFVKLKLDIAAFDERPFIDRLIGAEARGVLFRTMASLGDTQTHRRQLYELNKICSADIPGRGKFFEYSEFCEQRYGTGYDSEGVIVALLNEEWIGMSANSNWQQHRFIFNEMTGVLRKNRQNGIATALKLYGVRYAKAIGVDWAYTVHDAENVAPIELNRRLGYEETDWVQLIPD